MARPKRNIQYTADAATIQRFFDKAMSAKEMQREASSEIMELNCEMQDSGVHAGLLSHYCKIARLPPEKAVHWLTLEDFYRQALASRLPSPEAPAEEVAVPFVREKRAAVG